MIWIISLAVLSIFLMFAIRNHVLHTDKLEIRLASELKKRCEESLKEDNYSGDLEERL